MDEVFTSAEAAKMIGCSPDSLRVFRQRYNVGKKVKGRWEFTMDDIREINQHRGKVGKRGPTKKPRLDESSKV